MVAPPSLIEPPVIEPSLIESARDLAQVVARARRAPRVALDVEGNGLFAFRAALCTVQLAWLEDERPVIALVDTLATGVSELAGLLGPEGPTKVLHDLSFDARMLADEGAPLARVRDTSVAARLLGFQATGLATLLASELGVRIEKDLQQHDWGKRPLEPEHLAYLAADVRYLLALDAHLERRATAMDLTDEIAVECAHKLASALGPPRDGRPAYVRAKGAAALDPVGRAVLRRLFATREAAAAAVDVPPFRIVGSEVLVELARKRPTSSMALAAVSGAAAGRARQHEGAWLAAIALGITEGDVPADEQALFTVLPEARDIRARRRTREGQVSAFRRAEAKLRGVDEQAILPGHCARDLVHALLAYDASPEEAALATAIANIAGLGTRRLERYGRTLVALATATPRAEPPTPEPGTGNDRA